MRNYWQEGKEGLQQIYAEYQRYNNPYFSAYEWLRGHYKNDIYGTAGLTYEFSDHFKVTGRTQITTYDLLGRKNFPIVLLHMVENNPKEIIERITEICLKIILMYYLPMKTTWVETLILIFRREVISGTSNMPLLMLLRIISMYQDGII